MALTAEKQYTIDDIYKLPEGKRAELIDGQIYYMSPPNRTHQKILNYLTTEINLYIRSKKGTCEVYPAPFAVFLNKDTNTYVEPDISVICDTDKLDDKGCHGAPDWVIEIVSPSTRYMDYGTKLFQYQAAGVQEYWIADYSKNRITVWNLVQNTINEFSFSDSVKAGIYEDCFIDFSQINL